MGRNPRKRRQTFHLSEDIVERARNAVYWTPGLTMSGLAEVGLQIVVQEVERNRNSGRPFKKRESKLVGGRPLDS